MFSACELGQRFSNGFDEIDDTVGQLDWYLLPIIIQKILPGTIQYTQQRFAVTFFESFSCSREQFKKASMTREPSQDKSGINTIEFISGGQCGIQILHGDS